MPFPLPTLLTALLCAATLSACTSLGGGDTRSAGALPDPDIVYEKHTLDNGLTLIIHQDHKAPIAAVNVWYHVGSKDEKPGRTGFAHLFEHLMFNGSENYNDEFFRPLEPAGATDFNGTTNSDRTNYFANVPTSALDLLLWLESDRMGHLLGAIDQAKLDEQRGVVQNEKRQGENQPYGLVWETITQHAYPAGHPYSWTTIGSMEDLNAARLEDVKDWFRTYYGAANAVLVVAGDVNPAEVRQKVEHYFGDIPSGPTLRRQQQWIAEMPGEKRVALQDRVPQARLYKVWNVPGYGTRDGALLQLAAERLGGGKTSLLYDRLVYRDRIATDASAFYFERELGGPCRGWSWRLWRAPSIRPSPLWCRTAPAPNPWHASRPVWWVSCCAGWNASAGSAANPTCWPRAKSTAARRTPGSPTCVICARPRPPRCAPPRNAGCTTAPWCSA
jgi:zinc protease